MRAWLTYLPSLSYQYKYLAEVPRILYLFLPDVTYGGNRYAIFSDQFLSDPVYLEEPALLMEIRWRWLKIGCRMWRWNKLKVT